MTRKVLIIALLALVAAAIAYGADVIIKAQIPFQFTAHGKLLPSGTYEFSIDFQAAIVTLRSEDRRTAVAIPVLTTMAPPAHSSATDVDVVFDKVGDQYTLSEVWNPTSPGILVFATKGKHEHRVIHSSPGTD